MRARSKKQNSPIPALIMPPVIAESAFPLISPTTTSTIRMTIKRNNIPPRAFLISAPLSVICNARNVPTMKNTHHCHDTISEKNAAITDGTKRKTLNGSSGSA